jgi:sugar phosphate isomerase/epimerase
MTRRPPGSRTVRGERDAVRRPAAAGPGAAPGWGPLLSTMWAQQPRFDADFAAFARVAREAGYAGIEVSHATDAAGLEALLRDGTLPVRSLHAPAPRTTARGGRVNGALNLASPDEEERREAVAHTLRTVDYAARAGARTVVVHLGEIGRGLLPEERALRALYAAGRIDAPEAATARAAAWSRRAEASAPFLAAARRSLAELVAAAAPRGVVVGLENRLHFHEIPSPEEAAALLEEYGAREAGYWHDIGHAEVQARLGLLDARGALRALAPRLVGVHLHDVRGITDHRAPGTGDVDWRSITAALRPDVVRTLEIDQHEPEHLLAAAIAFLRARGVLPDSSLTAGGLPAGVRHPE